MTINSSTVKYKIITCFLRAGLGQDVLERLRKEKDIHNTFAYHARGTGLAARRGTRRPEYVEREMISALVPVERADEIFRFIFFASGIDKPHGGMVLMTASPCAATWGLSEEMKKID